MCVRELTADEVVFVLECHPEDTPLRGNCSAVSDVYDEKVERWIRRQLADGNQWAWCSVVVRARWCEFDGADSLGCCSYRSEADFKQSGGYFDDMKVEALAALNEAVQDSAGRLWPLLAHDECSSSATGGSYDR